MNGLGADEKHLVHQPFLKKSVDGRGTAFHEETLNFTVRKLIQKRGQATEVLLHEQGFALLVHHLSVGVDSMFRVQHHTQWLT